MKKMLFNATYQEELRVATVEGQRLINFDIETSSKAQRRGNIYKGIITRVEHSLEACFVDYGTEKQGFLPFKEIDTMYLPEGSRHRDFSRLQEGTSLIIQVEKDERGNKGAALTTYVSLPGRYLVLMPNNSRSGGISRRIDGDERDELKTVLSSLEVPDSMSIIARTAALGRVQEELQWDLNYLLKLWNAVKTAATSHEGSFLVYPESSLVIRSIRDHFSPDITEILIDIKEIYEQAHQFMAHVMPNYLDRVKFYQDDVPLFSRFQIEHQIESAFSRGVNLPSGGSIVIDHTEALTAVDVNSAKANKGADIEATAFATNLEAAEEVARQMRLRDLGGLVVVDFIDMENVRNQREVENFFKQQLGLDRARIQMGKLSKFGLLELSRQRLQASLEESTTIACPRCSGVGVIRGTESTAIHILRIIQEEVVKPSHSLSAIQVQLPVPVATYLLNEKREDVASIETRMKVKIILIPNVHLDSPNYKIKKVFNDSYDANSNKLSYHLVESPEETQLNTQAYAKKPDMAAHTALVQNITPSQPAPVVQSATSTLGKFITKIVKLVQNNITSSTTPASTSAKHSTQSRSSNTSSYQGNNRNQTSNTNKPYNKTRPVGVNRSNNKIQTVRPNSTSDVADQAGIEAVRPTTQDRQSHNPRTPRAQNREPQDGENRRTNTRSQPQNRSTSNRSTEPRATPAQNNRRTPAEDKTSAIAKPHSPIISAAVDKAPVATMAIAAPTPIAPAVVEAKPVVRKENTITHKIDLGNLELVSTDNNFVPPVVTVVELNLKRHNDLQPHERPQAPVAVEYEMVETKAN